MPSASTPHLHPVSPAHQNFHWIHDPGHKKALAEFVELTKDISSGINTCLQIIYASDLVREQQVDAEVDELISPAIGKSDAESLFRFSLAGAGLLQYMADEKIEEMNTLE